MQSEAYDGYVPIDDAAEMARLVPAALAAFGTPRVMDLEASDLCGIAWDTLYAALPCIVDAQQHPLSASAARTRLYFDLFVAPVISTMNRTRPRQLFTIGHDLHIAVDQQEDLANNHPRIHVRGDSSAYVACNGQPFCLVDLKPYDAQTTVHFDAGRNQALLGAAALGFKERQPKVLAIATDLARWQFFTVSENELAESRVLQVTYDANGVPDGSLRDVLRYMVGFLAKEWPLDSRLP